MGARYSLFTVDMVKAQTHSKLAAFRATAVRG